MITVPSGLVWAWASAITAFAPMSANLPLDEVVSALAQDTVYVAPGTEDTNNDTAGILRSQLYDNDNIVIVMLPAEEQALSSGELLSFARRIDDSLEGDQIVGLSVGNQIVAYSATLPAGEATDLMDRAINVSINTPEALGTFVRNVHSWQSQHPEAVASQPTKKPDDGSSVPLVFGGAGLLIACAVGAALFKRATDKQRRAIDHVSLKVAPDPVKDILEPILKLRTRVNDTQLRDVITQLASDTEAYFGRNQTRKGEPLRSDAEEFVRHLKSLHSVLERYVDVQDHPRYFDNPQHLLDQGSKAINGFAEFVLTNVRRGSREALTNYRVDTDILAAKRYS